jgi:hypothetical protein
MPDTTVKHRICKVKKPVRGGMMIDVQRHTEAIISLPNGFQRPVEKRFKLLLGDVESRRRLDVSAVCGRTRFEHSSSSVQRWINE